MAARFIISAARPEQFPPEAGPEVAFLGRSNVGKSSLINALVGTATGQMPAKGGLARTSARPGCTQLINFYQVESYRFVDLPGYGFAKVPLEISRQWKSLIDSYLAQRGTFQLGIILLDARRGWMEKDLELREWLEENRRPYVVAASKVDKLKSQKETQQSRQALREGYAGKLFEYSAITGRGVREIWQAISKTKTQKP